MKLDKAVERAQRLHQESRVRTEWLLLISVVMIRGVGGAWGGRRRKERGLQLWLWLSGLLFPVFQKLEGIVKVESANAGVAGVGHQLRQRWSCWSWPPTPPTPATLELLELATNSANSGNSGAGVAGVGHQLRQLRRWSCWSWPSTPPTPASLGTPPLGGDTVLLPVHHRLVELRGLVVQWWYNADKQTF